MPFTFKIPPKSRWTKKGTCSIICTYRRTLAGRRYPEKQWPATYQNGQTITIKAADWVPYSATPSRKQPVCRVNVQNDFAAFINARLDELERSAEIIEKKMIARSQTITPQTFRELWKIEFSENPVLDVFELYLADKWKQVAAGKLATSTARNNESLKKHLAKIPGMRFEGFHPNFPDEFADKFPDLNQGGLRHYLLVLRAFLRWSYKKKYHRSDDFEGWEIPEQTKKEFSLKGWQIKRIANADLSDQPPAVIWARDYFMFLFWTAMRLREPKSIIEFKGESDFVRMFKYKVSKQDKAVWVSFKPPENVLEIWDRYPGKIMRFSQNTIRTRLREVGQLAGLTPDEVKQLTPHVARHSFITIARELGITKDEVQDHTMQTDKVLEIYDHSEKRSKVVGEFSKLFGT